MREFSLATPVCDPGFPGAWRRVGGRSVGRVGVQTSIVDADLACQPERDSALSTMPPAAHLNGSSMPVCWCFFRRYKPTGIVDLSGVGLFDVGVAQQPVCYGRVPG